MITIIFMLMLLPVFGQEESLPSPRKNEAKLMVSDLLSGTVLLGYERSVGNHTGVALNAGYKSKDGLLRLSGLDTDLIKTDELTYSGLRIIPEFRYYLNERNNGRLTGFYFGAYATFISYKSDFKGLYSNENGDFDFFYEAKANINSIGLMVGYKLAISKRFSIDFLIAGPGAGSYRFKLKEITPAPPEFWVDLNDALELYSLADLINADFDFSEGNSSDSLILPSFRYGITLGYSF
jgi:hypothetical protein